MNRLLLFLITLTIGVSDGFAWDLAKNDIIQRSPTRAYYQFRKTFRKDIRAVTMDLFLFDTRRCQLRVMDQGSASSSSRKYGNLKEAMKAERCLAGINGSYFDKAFRPLGLVIDGGKPVHGRGTSPLLTGVVATDGRMVEMLWKGEATRLRSMVDAIEAGPRLIDGKLPVRGLSDLKRRRRTFILTNGRGWWGIGICRSVSLKEQAEILADRSLLPEIDVLRALNLDGGSSTAFWARGRTDTNATYVPEWSAVRNFVGVVALPR